jgi:hypothetical protein
MFLICERQLRDLNNVAVTRWTVDPSLPPYRLVNELLRFSDRMTIYYARADKSAT